MKIPALLFLQLNDALSPETKFLFHLDFAPRHYAERLTEMHTVINVVEKLRKETGQDWVFVGTQLQFVNLNRLPDGTVPLQELLDTEHMEANLPFLTWESFLEYIGNERGLHKDDRPTIVFDQIIELQKDSKTGEILLSEENEDEFITHSASIANCYMEPKRSKSGRVKKDFWDIPGLTAKNYTCVDVIGSIGTVVKILGGLDDRIVVLSSQNCEDCINDIYSDEGEEEYLSYDDFWNTWKYINFAQRHREIAEQELENRMGNDANYVGLIWYSHWSEHNQKYVEDIREKTGEKTILLQSLLQDRHDLKQWKEKLDGNYWSTSICDKEPLVFKSHDVQIRDIQMMQKATDFFGLYNDRFTEIVFIKRALAGVPEERNFKYSCLSFKCESGFYQDGEFPRPKMIKDEL